MPADRELADKVTALGVAVVKILREVKSGANADQLQRCLDVLATPGGSHLDALRKIEDMCNPKWLGDDYAAAARSDWEQMLSQLRNHANVAAASVFRAPAA